MVCAEKSWMSFSTNNLPCFLVADWKQSSSLTVQNTSTVSFPHTCVLTFIECIQQQPTATATMQLCNLYGEWQQWFTIPCALLYEANASPCPTGEPVLEWCVCVYVCTLKYAYLDVCISRRMKMVPAFRYVHTTRQHPLSICRFWPLVSHSSSPWAKILSGKKHTNYTKEFPLLLAICCATASLNRGSMKARPRGRFAHTNLLSWCKTNIFGDTVGWNYILDVPIGQTFGTILLWDLLLQRCLSAAAGPASSALVWHAVAIA